MIKLQVILGSTRPNRQSEKIGKWVMDQLSKTSEINAEVVDLKDWDLPFYQEISGLASLQGPLSSEIAKKWQEKVKEADGYIILVPEYNHGYPAVLKNALDYAYFEWNKKPVGFVGYGGIVAGARAVEQLRLVVIELQMVPIKNATYIPFIWSAFDEKGNLKDIEKYNQSLDELLKQLLWWAKVLKEAREKS